MLYVSTRNYHDSYTAYRALREEHTPEGGFYVPLRLPVFTDEEIFAIKTQSCVDTIAQLLNLFSGLRITGWDVECVIGRYPFKLQSVGQKLVIAEAWRNPENDYSYVLKGLYGLLLEDKGTNKMPVGWPRIAIEIALLFGLYSSAEVVPTQKLDFAITADDFSLITAICFAKNMGMPVNLTICACSENSIVWDLVNKGAFSTRVDQPAYLECLLYCLFGQPAVLGYVNACGLNTSFHIAEEAIPVLDSYLYAAVISDKRIDTIVSGMYSTNQCLLDPCTALAYGSLQDYRSQSGINNDTFILSKQRAK